MMHLELKLGISLKTLEENMLTCLSDSHSQSIVHDIRLLLSYSR